MGGTRRAGTLGRGRAGPAMAPGGVTCRATLWGLVHSAVQAGDPEG